MFLICYVCSRNVEFSEKKIFLNNFFFNNDNIYIIKNSTTYKLKMLILE